MHIEKHVLNIKIKIIIKIDNKLFESKAKFIDNNRQDNKRKLLSALKITKVIGHMRSSEYILISLYNNNV
jgi:hypothetical protein